eukprot:scaffold93514_cov23-Tisochrysis_lutea.AAC.1
MGRKWVRWARMAAMAEVLVSVHAQPQHSRNPLANHAVCVHVRACVCDDVRLSVDKELSMECLGCWH